ncbi:RCC1 domain-containing protein [Paenibacillus sp. Soil522]|uniref:RCC1 domain-containing protein n=1 Tax=Paenibacillus sp. Soil522 TaxID=1736388 RepID=UPI0006F5ABDB|nr:fibronectin type III domain-containing protein [Paenibacillus sp. Soil522]KRE33945.1 hypothetical protein ASG81_23150 [Paenibacillus sp. Soil522]
MRRWFMLLVCGFLLLTLLLPFQAATAEAGSAVVAESSNAGVTMVAAGGGHLALKEDGTVWTWGDGLPVQVKDLEEVVTVAAGGGHSLALKEDGTVWAWGSNEYGVLGKDPYNTGSSLTPVQVQGLSSVVAIAASGQHNLALESDGTVWAWGLNSSGQLGNGTATDHLTYFHTPAQVRDLDSVTAVAAGAGLSLAIKSDGTVWAWGNNYYRDVSGTTLTPVQVQGLSSVVSIDTSGSHSLAVKSDGTLWVWGYNSAGQLGDGTRTARNTPVQLQGLSSVAAIDADEGYSLALKSDGTVWAWGCIPKGGECYESDIRTTPVQVQDLSSVVGISAGFGHSLALKSDGTVWAWGGNMYAQLGDGTRRAGYIPFKVQGFGWASPETPEWPAGDVLTVADVTYNSVQLNWQPATDDTGVDMYLVYQDNTPLGTLNGDVNSYEVKGLSPKSSYLFSLVAIDAAGNQSVKKDVTVTTTVYNPVPKPETLLYRFNGTIPGSGSETLLYRFNGTILDFDKSRILWKKPGDKVLWLYNQTDGNQVMVDDVTGADYIIRTAKLSADGVVYSLSGGKVATHYWKDGAVQNSWHGQSLYEAKGNFVVFTSSVVDVTTGQSRTLPNSNFKNTNRFDLSGDGTVVYVDPTYRSNLYKSLPDGTLTTLVPPSADYLSYGGPLTDGKNIIYKVLKWTSSGYKWGVRLRDANDKITTLALNPFYKPFFTNTRTDYQINNGWIAYQEYNKEKDNWILYVRSPEGETKQIFETPSQTWKQSWYSRVGLSINQLEADGSVVYAANSGTYLYSAQENRHVPVSGVPGKLEYQEYVFSGPGEKQYRFGAWYRLDGGSLYAIRMS